MARQRHITQAQEQALNQIGQRLSQRRPDHTWTPDEMQDEFAKEAKNRPELQEGLYEMAAEEALDFVHKLGYLRGTEEYPEYHRASADVLRKHAEREAGMLKGELHIVELLADDMYAVFEQKFIDGYARGALDIPREDEPAEDEPEE